MNQKITDQHTEPARKVSAALAIGIVLLPWLFIWFLLRKGHSMLSRCLGFGYFASLLALQFVVSPGSDQQAASPAKLQASSPMTIQSIKQTPQTEMASEPEKTAGEWVYDTQEDKMRGQISHLASLTSKESVALAFPYDGGADLMLVLRDDAAYGKDIFFSLSKGQLPCMTYDNCTIKVKFDQQPLKTINATGPAHGRGDVLFIAGTQQRKQFMTSLRKASKLSVEVEIYNEGRHQFTFNTAGLNWNRF